MGNMVTPQPNFQPINQQPAMPTKPAQPAFQPSPKTVVSAPTVQTKNSYQNNC